VLSFHGCFRWEFFIIVEHYGKETKLIRPSA
jgi:hypothetical protein